MTGRDFVVRWRVKVGFGVFRNVVAIFVLDVENRRAKKLHSLPDTLLHI